METRTDASFGVIPLFKTETGAFEVLVIEQYGSAGDVYWGFPKGHAEGEESPADAALRELREETGLATIDLDTGGTFLQAYTFVSGDTRIEKTVTYYLGYTKTKELTLQAKEIKNAKWCTFEDAVKLLTHDGTRKMFGEVERTLGA